MSDTSPWAPFQRRAFRWLWFGVALSGVGMWAQTVGAQWLFVNDPNAAAIVSLVQTASSLPIVLLALPAGVLADVFDRRWIMVAVQIYAIAVAIALAVLTALDRMPPLLLLTFTFAVGVGMAILIPTWQPLIVDLVPRSQLAAATRLDLVSVNVARAVGPAIAGVIIAAKGVWPVFVFNAACAVPLLLILLAWHRRIDLPPTRERFLPALRTGGRYVRHEPVVRTIIGRLVAFIAPATAMWALLPLIANRHLGLGASGYGLLFAALGTGAVAGGLTLGAVKRVMSSNAILTVSALLMGAALALLMLLPWLPVALPLLVVAGYVWTATASTLVAELQLFLPGWVRARAVAVYMMGFTGTQALVSPLWGLLAQYASLRIAILTAAGIVALTALLHKVMPLPENAAADRSAVEYWGEAPRVDDLAPGAGPVIVTVELVIDPEQEPDFLAAMQELRRSRLRSGAFRWELYRVVEAPGHFVELFSVESWEEHVLQHQNRLTREDQGIEELAFSYSTEPLISRHLIPPERAHPDGQTPIAPSGPA